MPGCGCGLRSRCNTSQKENAVPRESQAFPTKPALSKAASKAVCIDTGRIVGKTIRIATIVVGRGSGGIDAGTVTAGAMEGGANLQTAIVETKSGLLLSRIGIAGTARPSRLWHRADGP